MKQKIRHRRLHAFFASKVLNSLMIVIIVSLMVMPYTKTMLLPAVCGSLALILFIGYSLWLWIKKPNSIVVNYWLSNINGCFTIYFLIISAMSPTNEWWYIFPISYTIVLMFVAMVRNQDEFFEIAQG
ncbi:MAG: hypothetical protein K2G01_06355 [Paramuribaculum sp.]|nr:hypothetical protein [Paramuribaculum sp.]